MLDKQELVLEEGLSIVCKVVMMWCTGVKRLQSCHFEKPTSPYCIWTDQNGQSMIFHAKSSFRGNYQKTSEMCSKNNLSR